jgi:mRNA interferase MazF
MLDIKVADINKLNNLRDKLEVVDKVHNNINQNVVMEHKINYNNTNWKDKNPQRMEIWYYDFGKGKGGSTQSGIRPCLISSNLLNNRYSTIRNVFPITSKINSKADIPVHVRISTDCGLKEESLVLAEQITTIDIRVGLLGYVGKVDELTMRKVDRARNIQLGEMEEKSPIEKLPKYIRIEIEEILDDIYTYEKVLYKATNESLRKNLLEQKEAFLWSLQKFCENNILNYRDFYKKYEPESVTLVM